MSSGTDKMSLSSDLHMVLLAAEPQCQAEVKEGLWCVLSHTVPSWSLLDPLCRALCVPSNLFEPLGGHGKKYSSPLCVCFCFPHLLFSSLNGEWNEDAIYFCSLSTKHKEVFLSPASR